jgi:hypothetical protein
MGADEGPRPEGPLPGLPPALAELCTLVQSSAGLGGTGRKVSGPGEGDLGDLSSMTDWVIAGRWNAERRACAGRG